MTNRRSFFKKTGLLTLGGILINPLDYLQASEVSVSFKNKKAKNIILLVSDGMSHGTLSMANQFCERKYGRKSNWLSLYDQNKVSRALMETASASSLVTDSAAGGSSWGGGHRVPNGKLNMSATGEKYVPIWKKFKKNGKKAGCVTTVPITHATPASFCTIQETRHSQEKIAEDYLQSRFDIMMGGGARYFESSTRKDNKDLVKTYRDNKFTVVQSRDEMLKATTDQPILGLFATDGLPYSIDRSTVDSISQKVPTLAEMTQKAIDTMQDHAEGFVLQVEAGKVDWAAHGNDIGGLLYDQLAFDDAIKTAIDFAEKDQETLVIITTDHGNANPGLIYGDDCNKNFDGLYDFKHSNDYILQDLSKDTSLAECKAVFKKANNISFNDEEAKQILDYYKNTSKEDGVYNYKKLPFSLIADLQKQHTSVGWISMKHSADDVELTMYGPGSHLLKPFIKNTDLHYLMLEAAEIENNF